ncbi:MAG TPA: phospholipase C, phosphocholine-specific [Verrucomicrobiae bacterium]
MKFVLTMLAAIWLVTFGQAVEAAALPDQISAANILVQQNDTNNTTDSVTVTTGLSINDFRIRSGSNRADYDVQIGALSTDDVTNGILMTSIDQNGRDNGELAFPGKNYGTSAIDSSASTSPGSSGEFWIPVFQVPQNAEYNFNVAAAYFPYTGGWYGGWLNNATGSNGGANNQLIGHPSLRLGTHVIDKGSGKTTIDLRAFGLDSRTNAILLVEGGKNEANFALSTTNADGTWTIFCHDDNVNGGAYEQDAIAFVCVPLTNHTVVSGKFLGNASIAMQSEPFKVTNPGLGTYHLTIPNVNPANGVLIISAEGGGPLNLDNIVSYQVNQDGWDIQTRDLTADFTPQLQNLSVTDAVVSFVYIPGPTPGSTSLFWSGSPSNQWDFANNLAWLTTNNTPANYVDGCQAIFNDSAANFTVNLATSIAPFAVTVASATHSFIFNGNGSITGATGLTKQGGGQLTLNPTNTYTGDTVISQGAVNLSSSESLPGGTGFGDVTLNGILNLAGYSCTVNNLSGAGRVDNIISSNVTLTVLETTNTTFSGILKNSAGAVSLNLTGSGSLSFSGTGNVSGNTTVSQGTLLINGTLNTASVAVQSGATLGGSGTVGGPISLAGNSSLNLTANAPLTVGSISLTGVVNVAIANPISQTNAATYLLLQYGSKSGNGAYKLTMPPGLLPNGFTATLNDTGTQLQLVVAPVVGITGTIADVRHVVILMNENRSFDHYFGTFHGVRGFNDRNAIQFTNKNNAFYQPSGSSYELPFHTSIQCISDLNHSWPVTHSTINGGKSDQWIPNKGKETMAYMSRDDIPYYYALADAYTICDEYHCSVLSSTYPNRFSLMTGMIDPNSTGGGPEIDNSTLVTGFTWKTYPEFLQDAGIDWKVFLVSGDSSDNVISQFAAFKQAKAGQPLYDRGRAASPTIAALVNAFQGAVISNTLPSVSWIIGPSAYTEHPPYSPANGQLLTKQLLDALAANPDVYKSTVFIFDYDENDGFYDHAMPILPPAGTPDEFVGSQPIGLGVRVPAIIVSPWTRGGRVCSQVFDHTSVIRFLETWTGVKDTNISAWRRQVCGDLTSAFDFAHPNADYPYLNGVAGISCPSGDTPSVPATQTMPVQESGAPIPMPLPYQPNAFCTLNPGANSFAITMTNAGAASVHFGVYPNAFRNDGPWPFDVNTTNSTSTLFDVSASSGKYDFSCYGPNGFQRRFAGNLTSDYQKIEAVPVLNPGIAGLKVELANTSTASVVFTVTNGYRLNGSSSYTVPAHATNVVSIGSETNNGFYDITVTASADSSFVRRFLGRVEMTPAPTVLASSQNPSALGDSVTFTLTESGYGTPTGTVQFKTNDVPAGAPGLLNNGIATFTIMPGCGDTMISAEYSGDMLNQAATNVLSQSVLAPPPVITLNGANPMTNWLGTVFMDPGATAFDLCAGLIPVTTNATVNSTLPGTYFVQYTAGNPPNDLVTNTRTVLVIAETPPIISGSKIMAGGNFQFTFSGPAGQPYTVMTTTNLSPTEIWNVLLSDHFDTNPAVFIETNILGQSMRFYRVISP